MADVLAEIEKRNKRNRELEKGFDLPGENPAANPKDREPTDYLAEIEKRMAELEGATPDVLDKRLADLTGEIESRQRSAADLYGGLSGDPVARWLESQSGTPANVAKATTDTPPSPALVVPSQAERNKQMERGFDVPGQPAAITATPEAPADPLKERKALASDMVTGLKGLSPDEFAARMAKFTARADQLGVDAGQLQRFAERQKLAPVPGTKEMMERSIDLDDQGFGGIAEQERMQASRAAGKPIGYGSGAKPLGNFSDRMQRMAVSASRRGQDGLARMLEGTAAKFATEEAFRDEMANEGNPEFDGRINSLRDWRAYFADEVEDGMTEEEAELERRRKAAAAAGRPQGNDAPVMAQE
jgi:hypothetical protein